jgi:hypothetical protein
MYDKFFESDFLPSTFPFGKGKWTPKLTLKAPLILVGQIM